MKSRSLRLSPGDPLCPLNKEDFEKFCSKPEVSEAGGKLILQTLPGIVNNAETTLLNSLGIIHSILKQVGYLDSNLLSCFISD